MKRRYLWLTAGVALIALALTVLGLPRRAEPRREPTTVAPPAQVSLVIADGSLSPSTAAVARGSLVRLDVQVHGRRPARLSLAGYEDRLTIPELAAGGTWRGEFLADRPGEDFAWLVDGVPAGRLAVTGSHLIEGHR